MFKIRNALFLLFSIIITNLYATTTNCKVVKKQCLDNAPTKIFNGIQFKLTDACKAKGIDPGSEDCCWSQTSQYYCGDSQDSCVNLRKNSKCMLDHNDCNKTDPLSGECLLFQSTYKCADDFTKVESQVCVNAVCASYKNQESSNKELKTCTPSPWGSDCQQYDNAGCTLVHKGSCEKAKTNTYRCNPFYTEANPKGTCTVYKNNPQCTMTKNATCADGAFGPAYANKSWSKSGYASTNWSSTTANMTVSTDNNITQGVLNIRSTVNSVGSPTEPETLDVTIKGNILQPVTEDTRINYSRHIGNGCWDATAEVTLLANSSCNATTDNCTYYFRVRSQHGNCDKDQVGDQSNIVALNFPYPDPNKLECTSGYQDAEYTCTDANNQCGKIDPSQYSCTNGAQQCYMDGLDPITKKAENISDLAQGIRTIEAGKMMGDELSSCSMTSGSDSTALHQCRLFAGKYRRCTIYEQKYMGDHIQDCGINMSYFDVFNRKDDKSKIGQVSTGNGFSNGDGIHGGSRYNYTLSGGDSNPVNAQMDQIGDAKSNNYNYNMNVNYNPNGNTVGTGGSGGMSMSNGKIISVKEDKANKDIGYLGEYKNDYAIKLALDKIKAEADPNFVAEYSFTQLGLKKPGGSAFKYGNNGGEPKVVGLCIYLGSWCNGNALASNSILGRIGCFGHEACCVGGGDDPIINRPDFNGKATQEEWCCFTSKVSLDMNLAGYDQGFISLWNSNNPQQYLDGKNKDLPGNANSDGKSCAGITIEQLSKIDFSKKDYFKNFSDDIEKRGTQSTQNIMNEKALQDQNVQYNMQIREQNTAKNKVVNGN